MSAPQEKNIQNTELSDGRFRKWEQALAPYEDDVEKFARENGLRVDKWYHDAPQWSIGKAQKPEDLNKVWWNIQLVYDEGGKKISLTAGAWIDTEYYVPDGKVHERRLSNSSIDFKAWWREEDPVKIEELLKTAYEKATSYKLKDLTDVSASITGKDGIRKPYNSRPQE